jgi:hypothetical protein
MLKISLIGIEEPSHCSQQVVLSEGLELAASTQNEHPSTGTNVSTETRICLTVQQNRGHKSKWLCDGYSHNNSVGLSPVNSSPKSDRTSARRIQVESCPAGLHGSSAERENPLLQQCFALGRCGSPSRRGSLQCCTSPLVLLPVRTCAALSVPRTP